jgi:glycosyltransferase involved in cell wall biosynthesis
MVGAGPLDEELRALAARLNMADKIAWLGERDARGVLAGFDIFALSSRKEGLPYVVLEAMAAGLPIVATTSAGVEVLVKTGVNGHVAKTGDVDSFAQGLIALATDPMQLAKCGAASRERAGLFTIDAMIDSTLAAYMLRDPSSDSQWNGQGSGDACANPAEYGQVRTLGHATQDITGEIASVPA